MENKTIKNIFWKELTIDNEFENYLNEIEKYNLGIPEKILKILYNRGINSKDKIIKFFNKEIKFLYPPFFFKNINEIIKKIKKYIDENKKIAIYGDSDIDGVLSSYILKEVLKILGSDAYIFLPDDEDLYGLSIKKINQIKENNVELIITVDNGISSVEEIEYAKNIGIDVIVTDHHNPPKKLPDCLILNPKVNNIVNLEILSGCGVVFKLIEALLFSTTKVYNNNYLLLDFKGFNYRIKDKKKLFLTSIICEVSNLKITKKYNFNIELNEEDLKYLNLKDEDFIDINNKVIKFGDIVNLNYFLNFIKEKLEKNFEIICFNKNLENFLLSFNITNEKINENKIKFIDNLFIKANKLELETLKIFENNYLFEEDKLYFNFFVALRENYPKIERYLEKYVPYVAIATIADIMPLIDENRTITSLGINLLNKKNIEIFNYLIEEIENLSYPIDSDDINWKISPIFNSPGRFGKGEILVELFLNKNKEKIKETLETLKNYNLKRTTKIEELVNKYKNIKLPIDNIIFVEINDTENGLSGLIASRLANIFNKPVIVTIINKNRISGSFRTMEYLNGYEFINKFELYFENYGGHYSACGFTIKHELYDKFKEDLKKEINLIQINYKVENYFDIVVSFDEFDENFLNWYNELEPFGEKFTKPIFLSYPVEVESIKYFGRNNSSALLKLVQENLFFEGIFFNLKDFYQELKKENIKGIIYQIQKNKNNFSENKNQFMLKIIDLIYE